jgi:hypothetical protein
MSDDDLSLFFDMDKLKDLPKRISNGNYRLTN